jgi:F-type H+-transporting ATPase subunit delta
MSVAVEQNAVDAIASDLDLVRRALTDSRELRLLLASPVVAEAKKALIVRTVFEGKIGKAALLFLDLLVRKHREVFLDEVIGRFLALRDEMRNLLSVDVASATELDAQQQKALKAELEKRTGKTISLRLEQDKAILGGLIVRIGDTVLDASVRRQLARLRERFLGTASLTTH